IPAAQIRLIRLGGRAGAPREHRLLAAGQPQPQSRGDLLSEVALHGENVGDLAVVLLAPHLPPLLHVGERGAEDEGIAARDQLAGYDATDVEVFADRERIDVLALVAER